MRGEADATPVETETIRVLHVDDEPDFPELAATYLRREDDRFEVTAAESVDDGLARLEDGYDCVVSDYEMPGQNGLDFLEAVRERDPDIPFILYTGKGSEEVASEAISAGVTDYLQKESGTGQYAVLANRITNAVSQYHSQRELAASQQRLSLLIEQSPMGVLEYNADFEIVSLNEKGEEIFGYTEEELRGETWKKLVTSASYDDVDEVTSALSAAEGGFHSTDENVRKNGERFICEWHNRIVTDDDGDVVGIVSLFQDVTEREERTERLERTSARLEALFERSPDMVNVHDAAGNIVDPNARLVEQTGYSKAELSSMKVWELDQTMSSERGRALWGEMDVGDRETVEGRFERRDGSTFPVEIHLRRLNIDGDDQFVVISRDISTRVERKHELERTNMVLSTLVETLPMGVLVENESREVLAINDRLFELFDMDGDTEAVIGRDCERVAEAVSGLFESAEGFVDRIDQLVYDVESARAEELSLADGRTFARSYEPIDFTADVDERFDAVAESGHLWVYRDITTQKQREQTLEQSNALLSTLFETLPVGVALLDGDGTVVRTNQRLEEMFRVGEGESTGHAHDEGTWDLFGRTGEPVADDEYPIAQVQKTGEAVYGYETKVQFPDGDERWISVDAAPISVAAGRKADADDAERGEDTSKVVAVITDITEQHENERDLKRQNDRLEEFAGVVSHDLRNPLTVAEGRLELAETEHESEHIAKAARAIDRSQRLVDDLLQLAREGDDLRNVEPVALARIVEDCWGNVETETTTLTVETTQTSCADPGRLKQLLENLMRNAVEHTDEAVTITVGDLETGFYIEDDGPGIPPEKRDDVLEVGYSTKRDNTGFGLAIVAKIAEAHGWELTITDSDEGGARFEITGVERAD